MDHTALPPAPPAIEPPTPPVAAPAPSAELPPVPPAPPLPPARPKLVRHSSPFRLLLVTCIALVAFFLLVRTLIMEPFGVPTGSMAPALSGHHRDGPCPRCGYLVRVGRPSSGSINEHFARVACPNCDAHFALTGVPDINGDRLLVDKNVFSLRKPRRWEMVVFHCPDPDPKEFGKPYVKRVIGLPGETLRIIGGDVYVIGPAGTREILRKGLAEVRETMIPVFDMTCAPKAGGWSERWLVSSASDPRLPAGTPDQPAGAPVVENNALVLDASQTPQTMTGVTYRNWHLDDRQEEPIRVWNSYDGAPRHFGQLPSAHDFILTCEVEVTAAAPGNEASFACRLLDGADAVSAEIRVGPRANGHVQLIRENHGGLGSAPGVALEVGRKYKLEYTFVDRRVMLALDGALVLPHADLPAVTSRGEVRRPLQLGARGCRVVVRNLRLARDIHYTHYGEHGTRHPVTMGPGEYYVLGDNSGNSQDSRKWPTPGVPEGDFIGKPFLIHQPLRVGRVTVGGRERVFQTLDWSRVRWLH